MAWGFRRKETVDDYIGILIPLDKAHLYSHSAKHGKLNYEHVNDADMEELLDDVEMQERQGEDEHETENETRGMLQTRAFEYSIKGLRAETRRGQGSGRNGSWTPYEIKSKLINKAIQDIGMGRYNWQLFFVCGFGWFADNLWLQGASLTLPSLSARFDIGEKEVRYTTSALFLGLSLGSSVWGIGSDYTGRRIPFNTTLLIAAIFGMASAFTQSWAGVCFTYAALGSGVGGSLPVDGSLFLEFLPDANSSLLTMLSVWWPVGQLVSSLIAWYTMANWPVDEGWRLFMATIGIMTFAMFAVRFFIFRLLESPKFLLNQGLQDEAVAVVHAIAYRNGTKTWLTSEILDEVAGTDDASADRLRPQPTGGLKEKLSKFSGDKMNQLFKEPKLRLATILIWTAWAAIGMGYPLFAAFLPQYFSKYSNADVQSETSSISGETYRNYAITSICGVPGSVLATWLVDQNSRFLGRKGTLACSTLLSAVFQLAFVVWGTSSTRQLIFSCVGAFTQNIMYGVLYAYTPEIFPAPVRGAGTGVASFLNRITGLFAPVLAANLPGDAAEGPIYASALLIAVAFVSMCFIPIETRGAQRL
ncbi:major facilitator superfamily domain-containing protein [Emericellopsis atlantica]|uniref:Major facilitator superfamily domain-containing protein n=1 Tax=Emericellopsis atlantica TaxID=2614577 RepID=A0A9P7ZGA4_9HYPO|nr:major facilitator superfamily domain-containing protein [Emericellopsis atlantica]KAG9251272.1 major facilitator superfamily domain-containing protein [Emericellopsis atlantica]